jgi:hypothetical protein
MYDIPAFNYPALAEAIRKMNCRAKKLGCRSLVLRVVREYEEERKNRLGAKYLQARMVIELEGETPKLSGWSLLAVVERQPNGENLVRTVPGRSVPEQYRITDTHCDHCQAVRQRKEVFILGHDDGRFVQVGRQCLADFLGGASVESLVERLVAQAELEFEADDLCCGVGDRNFGDRRAFCRDIAEYLTVVAVVIRRLGWVSNTAVRERGEGQVSTSHLAWSLLIDYCTPYVQELIAQHDLRAEERDEKLAREALEWAKKQPADASGAPGASDASDYLYNLGVACRQTFVTYKTAGIVASAIAAYQRHLDREAELNTRRRQNLKRRHVGEIGKRCEFENVTVVRLRYYEGRFGVKAMVLFEDANGNRLVWWASKEPDVEEGDVVSLQGTVTAHNDYQGCPQTALQRVKITRKQPARAKFLGFGLQNDLEKTNW